MIGEIRIGVPARIPAALLDQLHGIQHQIRERLAAKALLHRRFHIHKHRILQPQPLQHRQKSVELLRYCAACGGIGIIIGAHAQPGSLGPVDIALKRRVDIYTVCIAGAYAHNGKLLARCRHSAPVHRALIA